MSEALGELAAEAGGADAVTRDATTGASTPALLNRLQIPTDSRRSVREDELLYLQFKEALPDIIMGVALAGGFCPIVVWSIFAVIGVVQAFWFGAPAEVFLTLLMSGIFCSFGGIIAFFYAAFVFVAVYWLVYWFARSLEMRGDLVWLAAFSGGLAGFVAVLPPFVLFLGFEPVAQNVSWQIAISALIVAAPTTVMGQIGGAWGVWRDRSYESAVAAASVAESAPSVQSEVAEAALNRPDDAKWIQFRIWHLLVISVWVSLLLTAIRLCGIDVLAGIVLIVGWTVFQTVTLLLGGLVLRLRMRSKGRRQTRST